ncbi:nudix hydrolase 20, chloroplastic-like [Phalaenopsis equestris]|uniref:nudix hydrolase 20, chloroplastic-like n=1 Tax=Phalaenopsis equestris TaxID=78828 RepID=UPI0009E5BEA1|nr:nudix hydrolase 20, chloroplastic-like [Phalaenopsis equestris]XP_020584478.1 nudix hydrolase 20, chloroplastic-like [Phalaenopsis equestris]
MASSYSPIAFAALRSYPSTRLGVGIRVAKPLKPACTRSMVNRLQAFLPVAGFGWDDVIRAAERDDDDPSDLRGYFQRLQTCNRGSDLRTQFVPFLVEDEVVGCVHEGFIKHLKKFQGVFTFMLDKDSCAAGAHVKIHSSLKTPEDRTSAVGDIIKCLGDLIPGVRNELYPVTSSFGKQVLVSLERAAAPYFGIKAYGVHMNGYVVKSGQKFLWVGKRSDLKPTYPGMLDHLVAGGLPFGISCKENLVKECEEEAGIPRFIAEKAISVGAVSYVDIEGHKFKRDVLFCYDLELSSDFVPKNEDGEVDSFKLIPVAHVANIVRRTEFFKPNCSLVIVDFLFRHGFINPDDIGYLSLLHSLRSGICS